MKHLIEFFRQGRLWHEAGKDWHWLTRAVFHALRHCLLAVELFIDRNLFGHAAALTYSSILGAVPILAIVFAIARGFGFEHLIEEKLNSNVRFTPEMTATIMDFVNSYLERARGGVFIGIGLLMLFYTLYSLSSYIENAFNSIWCVKQSRAIYRGAVNYISVFFLLPVIVVITSGLQIFLTGVGHFFPDFTFVNAGIEFLVQLSPYVLACIAFILLYKLMPNTAVHWRATLLPGILAGTAFQGLQWFYIHSQVWISSYNAIYGSFAAIPLFMLFIQFSWYICLFGAGLSYTHQYEDALAAEKRRAAVAPPASPDAHNNPTAEETLDRIKELIQQYQALS